MDNIRVFLFLTLGLVAMMLWQAWEQDYGGRVDKVTTGQPVTTPDITRGSQGEDIPDLDKNDLNRVKTLAPGQEKQPVTQQVIVNTDVFKIILDSRGAGIKQTELIKYPVAIDKPDQPLLLMGDTPEFFYVSQGGLISPQAAPTHKDVFISEKQEYTLGDNEEVLRVPFVWTSDKGVKVIKTYEFKRGSYLININYEIINNDITAWQGRSYSQIKRNNPSRAGRRLIYTYTGAVLSGPENRYEKIKFDDIAEQEIDREISGGWAAMIQHYFISALIPIDTANAYHYYTKALPDERYIIGALTPARLIYPGKTGLIQEQVYIGPKLQKVLKSVAEGLELTTDYGVLWFLAKPLFWGLTKLHEYTGNWGWAIILVTVILKILFYRLSAAGYRSMANMRRVQPRIMSIRDRYKNDKARLNQAMMQIYKEEKINPLGGCFPILIQIPVFIALYWVLLESVEMRQASFIFWLNDLSSPDPFWVLPIIMGITMFIQQRLNPAPMDPVQEKVMMIMPFAFTVFFGFFPSGLVLYWVANNTLSIAQQWLITRSLERAGLSIRHNKK